jgi:hypothetical protein
MITNYKDKFDQFCSQNIGIATDHRISIENRQRNKIDTKKLTTWRNEMISRLSLRYEQTAPVDCKKLIHFVNEFSSKLTHVSITDFFSTFESVIDDLINDLKILNTRTPSPFAVILCMEEKIGKSSVWLSILYWNRIKLYISHVFTFDEARVFISSNNEKYICVVYIDDAAYSGQQIRTNLSFIYKDVKLEKNANIHQFFVVPYISFRAKYLFESVFSKYRLWSSDKSKIFYSLYHANANGRVIQSDQMFWEKYFFNVGAIYNIIPDLHVIYFDHKLADTTSVYTQLIAYSITIPPADKELTIENVQVGPGFISGCFEYVSKTALQVLEIEASQTADTELCPFPTYKNVGYFFAEKNKAFNDKNEQFLESLKFQVCFGCGARAIGQCPVSKHVFCGRSCQIDFNC